MALALSRRAILRPISRFDGRRTLATSTSPSPSSSSMPESPETETTPSAPEPFHPPPNTHFKITLRRSAISLGDKIKGTLLALGIHRRFQTVYFPHSPEVAGKILRVKELVEVENVPMHAVMTSTQQRQARKATRGYKVVGTRKDKFLNI